MADRVGQQFGNYRLIQLLASGGFAEVYLAEHRQLEMKAAIKILYAHLEGSEISRFRQEARMIANLKHPHIIRVLDFDVQNGTPFLVLDYASKGSLHALHPRGDKLPLDLVVTYVQQIASALQHAHEHKLIHRDVKPGNVLIGENGQLLLSDFGIATIAHSTSSMATSAMMGTLAYMAPEQILGKPRPASDQYALAVTVYQWLTGHLPFVGSSTEIIAQHLGAPPPPLRTHVPDVPAPVEQVVLTALAKDPQQRFGSVQAFAHALSIASGQADVTPLRPLALPVQSPEPAPDVTAQQGSPEVVVAGQERSHMLAAQPALTPSLPSSLTPSVKLEPPPLPSSPRRWIKSMAISGLVLMVVIGSVLWFTRPGQGDGTLASPYRLLAGSTDVQAVDLSLKGTALDSTGSSTGSSVPDLTVVSLQITGGQTVVRLAWDGGSFSSCLVYASFQESSNRYLSGNGVIVSQGPSLNVIAFNAVPKGGQLWMMDVSIGCDYFRGQDDDYTMYFQF
jgi:serine/threonine protein kinase